MDSFWEIIETGAGVAVVASVMAFILKIIFQYKPEAKTWIDRIDPYLDAAIKMAEKAIPDDSGNKSIERLNKAVDYLIAVREAMKNTDLNQTGAPYSNEISREDRDLLEARIIQRHAEIESDLEKTKGDKIRNKIMVEDYARLSKIKNIPTEDLDEVARVYNFSPEDLTETTKTDVENIN